MGWEASFNAVGLRPLHLNFALRCSLYTDVIQAARYGEGIALGWGRLVHDLVESRELVRLPVASLKADHEKLLESQFSDRLTEATFLSLEANFHEIVSKGLAIECARKTFTEGTGDFQAVTYNRLCLLLAADDGHPGIHRYKPQFNGGMADSLDDGVLLLNRPGFCGGSNS